VVAAAAASSVSFFIVSNFAVWAWSGMYPETPAGLMACYEAAIPFFRGTAVSDLFFSLLMFGIPALQHALAGRMGSAGNHTAAAWPGRSVRFIDASVSTPFSDRGRAFFLSLRVLAKSHTTRTISRNAPESNIQCCLKIPPK